jgi:hypothetical protein
VGNLVDFLPLGCIQFLVLLIGPTYLLGSVQTPNQARTQNTAYDAFTDSQPQQNLRWEDGLANKLDILCCFRLQTHKKFAVSTHCIAVNREI